MKYYSLREMWLFIFFYIIIIKFFFYACVLVLGYTCEWSPTLNKDEKN